MHDVERSSTTEGLPVSPSMGPAMALAKMPTHVTPIDMRVILICAVSAVVGLAAGFAAHLLLMLIAFFTHLSFYGKFSTAMPADARGNQLGIFVIFIPVIGAIVIGFIARYGSRAIAGHGIPEAMEQVLTNESRIPARLTFLKPFSAAISIGTGGPFGAEGPIIATGGALGSLVGQIMRTTAAERKVLLSAGAAAGIAAAFNTPIAAVLLAIELLLFEFRPRSIIPVALASAVAAMVHIHYEGADAMFPFAGAVVASPSIVALITYTVLGAIMGIAASLMTQMVYAVEAFFEHLPIHWMWCPAVGAVVVGVIGYFDPWIFGPGYFNMRWLLSDEMFSGNVALKAAAILCILKFLAWTISLGSGTAGGTLAPVFTIGGSFAAVMAIFAQRIFPHCQIDIRMAALMGMVAIFAGASRALLTSVVFAIEITYCPQAILPSLCGCAAAYLVSALLMRHSIMTEKMSRQGVRVPVEYGADLFEQKLVKDVMSPKPVTLEENKTLAEVRQWIDTIEPGSTHQGYPVVDEKGVLTGVLTRRDLTNPKHALTTRLKELIRRPPVLVYSDCTLRDAADHMVNHEIGRLPVIERGRQGSVIGMITRSDLIAARS